LHCVYNLSEYNNVLGLGNLEKKTHKNIFEKQKRENKKQRGGGRGSSYLGTD